MTLIARIGTRLDAIRRWESTLVVVAGITIMGVGLAMIGPLITGLLYGENVRAFFLPVIGCMCVSLPMFMLFRFGKGLRPVDGLLLIIAVWGLVTLTAAIPFFLSGMTFVDGFFESVSGFTTTGATVMTDIDLAPRSLLLWRAITQWAGGIAVILIFIALFPMLGFGGRSMFSNEMSGSGSKNLTARMTDVALQFILVYAILSGIFLVISILMGVDPFEAVCLTFSTISTGGFMIHDDSAAILPSYVQMLMLVFMFLGATNFYLHYQRMYRKKGAGYLKNAEFRWMLMIFAIASVIIFLLTFTETGNDLLMHAKDVVFTVVSIGSSTGFMVVDTATWKNVAMGAVGVIFILALIGGSSGSTAGGLKMGRASAILMHLTVDVKKRLYPRGVFETKVGGEALDESTLNAAYVLFILFAITILGGMVVLMMLEPGLGLDGSLFASLTSVTNCGHIVPFDAVGYEDGFVAFNDYSKLFLSALMWIGRLEIGTAIILLTPYFWKEIFRGRRKIRREARQKRTEL